MNCVKYDDIIHFLLVFFYILLYQVATALFVNGLYKLLF